MGTWVRGPGWPAIVRLRSSTAPRRRSSGRSKRSERKHKRPELRCNAKVCKTLFNSCLFLNQSQIYQIYQLLVIPKHKILDSWFFRVHIVISKNIFRRIFQSINITKYIEQLYDPDLVGGLGWWLGFLGSPYERRGSSLIPNHQPKPPIYH